MHWTAPAAKDAATATLEKRLWDAADELRANSGLKAGQYSQPVLGLIFLRFADARFAACRATLAKAATGRRGSRVDDAGSYHAAGVLFLPPEARFSVLLEYPEGGKDKKSLGRAVDDAMRAVERENPQLAGVLPKTYQQFNARLLKELLKTFSTIPMDLEGDSFGKIYEYFLGEFAMAEGSGGGEFYTPLAIVRLMVEILEPFQGRVLDPACGSGGMFVQSARFVAEHKKNGGSSGISIHGVEKTDETGQLCRLNLAVHGLEGDIRHGGDINSYYDDPHNMVGRFDFVLANPPFNVDKVDKERIRDSVGPGRRYPFGLPKTDNANYLWIQLFYSALSAKGRAGFVMANSASDARSSELELRKQLVLAPAVDVVVSVGSNMFYTVTLPCTLWFLDRGKPKDRRDKVLFLDVRHVYRQIDRAHRDWTEGQIGFLANVVRLYRGENVDVICGGEEASAKLREVFGKKPKYADVLGLCKVASLKEIEAQGWSLNPGRYVGVAPGEDVSDEDFKAQFEALNEEFEKLTAEARTLEKTIAKNAVEILGGVMEQWRETTLGELIRIKHGFAFKGEHFATAGDSILLTPGNFNADGGLKLKGEKEKYYTGPIPDDFVLSKGDLLIAMTDLTQNAPILGSAAWIPESDRFLHNQRLGKIVDANLREATLGFVYYVLNSPHVRAQIRATATGATVKHTAPERVYSVRIGLPALDTQRRIAGILSAYDDLIENCERRIRVLDEMARALYREWFVLFRYPGHEKTPLFDSPLGRIPKGWEHRFVKDVALVTYGYPFASASFSTEHAGLPVVRIRDILDGASSTYTTETADDRYLIKDGDILVGMDGDFHMCIWSNGAAFQNQRVARFEPSSAWATLHFYLALEPSIQVLNRAIVGTTVAHLGDAHIKRTTVLVPDEPILARSRAVFQPLGDEIQWASSPLRSTARNPRPPPPPPPLRPALRRGRRMTANAYSEDALVEQAAVEILGSLHWASLSATRETFGSNGTLGRESAREVALLPRLRAALTELNPDAPRAALDLAMDELLRDRVAMGPAAANREVHRLLTEGVKLSTKDEQTGKEEPRTLRVIDWEHPTENDFLAVRQLELKGPLYTCIPDVVLFVNGLPLVVIELKRPGVSVRQAFDENLTSYKHPQNGVPQLFAFNALLIASNGTEAKVGSLTADWGRFFDWKRVESESEERRVSLEVLLRGTCEHGRLLDLVRNFSLFSEHKSGLTKILSQNHQFLGVNQAIEATLAARAAGHGRAGVFWQTQGSGKSFSMVFYAQKILRTVPGNWTFVVITDRIELDDQIAKTFAACGAVEDATKCHASSGAHLRKLLGENHRYIFTLLHKFQTSEVLNDRRDVIVIADEAHRSQYDTLAMNMRTALPNALFVAFTGTPLIAGEERTREIFGDYVSIYDFQQSIEDGATVPLFYDNRTPELELTNPSLNDDLYDVIDDANLDEQSEARIQKLLGQRYHLITRDDRLDTIAKDIVQHFLGRGFQGKAMVVSIDKATALRTYDKVRREWAAETARVTAESQRLRLTDEERAELRERLRRLEAVDMALIVSPGQNEIEEMNKLGLDILPHRQRMVESVPGLDEKFKDPNDPLSLVFVCAMWLTGFDAPSCSTVYLDKPMRNHTLMQTIARANRVYPGKHSGVIVDYANVFESLEKALALYGTAGSTRTPVQNKDALVDELRTSLANLDEFCDMAGLALGTIEASATALSRLTLVAQAANALLAPDERRKAYLAQARLAQRLYTAIKPHKRASEFAVRMATVSALSEKIREATTPGKADITEVLQRIGEVLDRSIEGALMVKEGPPAIDLSRIDFRALAAKFRSSKSKNLDLERLKAAIRAQLDRLIAVNETRVDLRAKFESLIDDYNAGSTQIEQLFLELLTLSRGLTEEEERHVREQLSEEELVVFDLLTRPGPDLSTEERNEVKKVARQLLAKLTGVLTIDWQKTAQARARVLDTIEAELDEGLPRAYTPEVFKAKAGAVFQHVYDRYARVA